VRRERGQRCNDDGEYKRFHVTPCD
jgi:hypothetical protein